MGHDVWIDAKIHGGKLWWDEIVERIRGASVFLVALSNHSRKSDPCQRELLYAQQLGIPVLPIQVGPLESMHIPAAMRQVIDYRGRGADVMVRIVEAITTLTA